LFAQPELFFFQYFSSFYLIFFGKSVHLHTRITFVSRVNFLHDGERGSYKNNFIIEQLHSMMNMCSSLSQAGEFNSNILRAIQRLN
jgi:hypothetical protein